MSLNIRLHCKGATAVPPSCLAPSRNSPLRYSRLAKQQLSIVCKAQTTEDAPAAASGSSFGTLVQTLLFGSCPTVRLCLLGAPPACADLCEHTLRLNGPSLTTPQAASRLERGRATCLRCQGSGTASCPSCKGGGVLKADKVKMNQVRHAADKVQGMISGNRSMRDSGWQMSNRCRKCRGTGRCTCPACQGLGVMDGG